MIKNFKSLKKKREKESTSDSAAGGLTLFLGHEVVGVTSAAAKDKLFAARSG